MILDLGRVHSLQWQCHQLAPALLLIDGELWLSVAMTEWKTMSVLRDHDHVRELFPASLDDTCAFHFNFNGTNLHACIINYAAGWVFSNVTFSFPGKVRWLQKLCLTSSSQVSSRQQFVSDQILIIVVVIHPKSGWPWCPDSANSFAEKAKWFLRLQ